MNINFETDTFIKILELCKGDEYTKKVEDDERYQKFIKQFPANKMLDLSLDDYCLGEGSKDNNFSWWLERGLEPVLGRYSPGTAKGHVIYKDTQNSLYKKKILKGLSDAEALENTLKVHNCISNADISKDLKWIDNNGQIVERAGISIRCTISNGRKLRLLTAYYPDFFLCITSTNHLKHFLLALGYQEKDVPRSRHPVARMMALKQFYEKAKEYNANLTTLGFSRLLYSDELGINPLNEEGTIESQDILVESDVEIEPEVSKNLILFGPPGTGKTYTTIEEAVKLADPVSYLMLLEDFEGDVGSFREALREQYQDLVERNRIVFTTFHQSFTYEDFVEGLKADTDENGNIKYTVEDGVFKNICSLAQPAKISSVEHNIDITGRKIWKMSLGDTSENDNSIYEECISNNRVLLGYGFDIDFSKSNSKAEIERSFIDAGVDLKEKDYSVISLNIFKNRIAKNDLIVISDGNRKFRAICEVTGDYQVLDSDERGAYLQGRSVKWLKVFEQSRPVGELFNKNLSQMTLYEVKPKSIKFNVLVEMLSGHASIGNKGTFTIGESFGSGYIVDKVTSDILELIKPNGNRLPIAMSILETLSDYVKRRVISIKDISNRSWSEKVGDSDLENYLINGYQNVIPLLVERLVDGVKGVAEPLGGNSEPDSYVLIIDEINRGNISKIFGELITLIEPDKRTGAKEEIKVILPVSKTEFSVPSNLHIVGTMNTADKSLSQLDLALRRRFKFIEMPPKPSLLGSVSVYGVKVRALLEVMNKRIELLLDRDHLIGHSYFMALMDISNASIREEHLAEIFRNKVLPLLQEYFYDDWERISWVLNDTEKNKKDRFVVEESNDVEGLFSAEVASQVLSRTFRINESAFYNSKSYIEIIQKTQETSA